MYSGERTLRAVNLSALSIFLALPIFNQTVMSAKGVAAADSFFLAQFCQHTEILQRRRVAGHAFATGNFLEQTAHDFSAARFRQRFRESHFVRLRDRADVSADMI